MKVGDKVIDRHGTKGVIEQICETKQIFVRQKPNVWCTYDNAGMLTVIN